MAGVSAGKVFGELGAVGVGWCRGLRSSLQGPGPCLPLAPSVKGFAVMCSSCELEIPGHGRATLPFRVLLVTLDTKAVRTVPTLILPIFPLLSQMFSQEFSVLS